MIIDPWKEAINNVYGNDIIRIDEINIIKLNKVCLYSLSYIDLVWGYLFGIKRDGVENRIEKVLSGLSKHVNNSSCLSIYLVTYGTGKCVLTRGLPDKTVPEPSSSASHKMMVIVNGSYDTTPFYRRTKGFINETLGLLPREYAVIALICMGETKMHILLEMLVGDNVNVATVDAETFDEKVFKGGDTVVL